MKYHYIYKITCLVNGKFYYGRHSTNNLDDGYFGSGKLLWRSIKLHGRENFSIEILEYLPSLEDVRNREREIVNEDLLKNALCMNLVLGGIGASQKGITRSAETRSRMSSASKGKPKSETHKAKCRVAALGLRHSDETKKKMSESRLGKHLPAFTEEHLKKMSESRKLRIISESSKKKTSESLLKRRALKIQITCPKCMKTGGESGMHRWHFNNCRSM